MSRTKGAKNKPKDISSTVVKEAKVKKIDGRKKRIVSKEQILAMQEGRRLAKLKAQEGLVEGQIDNIKKEKAGNIQIVGYGINHSDNEGYEGWPFPIFESEKDTYKGKIYSSAKLAREAKV